MSEDICSWICLVLMLYLFWGMGQPCHKYNYFGRFILWYFRDGCDGNGLNKGSGASGFGGGFGGGW